MNPLSRWLMARCLTEIEGLERIMEGIGHSSLTPAGKSAARLLILQNKPYCLELVSCLNYVAPERKTERESRTIGVAKRLVELVSPSFTPREYGQIQKSADYTCFCFYTCLGGAGSPNPSEDGFTYLNRINHDFYAELAQRLSNNRRS